MAEYIGKEEVLKIVYDIKENKEIPKNYGTLLDIIRLVRNIPTADVVEVVRCGRCKYAHFNQDSLYYSCKRKGYFSEIVKPDHFCSCGERRDTK